MDDDDADIVEVTTATVLHLAGRMSSPRTRSPCPKGGLRYNSSRPTTGTAQSIQPLVSEMEEAEIEASRLVPVSLHLSDEDEPMAGDRCQRASSGGVAKGDGIGHRGYGCTHASLL